VNGSAGLLDQIGIRVGTIESVEDIPGADKLVVLPVDFGDQRRRVVAGLKPKEIEGKQALFVVNLEPRRMRSVLLAGMLFDIGYADGITPVLPAPERPVPNGCRGGWDRRGLFIAGEWL
jgi:tRNA-binding EMAP/Myf-like protein